MKFAFSQCRYALRTSEITAQPSSYELTEFGCFIDHSLVITFPIAINRHHEGDAGSEESKLREIVPRRSEHEAVVTMKSHQC